MLVSGKNCVLAHQKQIREFFCCSPRTKAGLRGNFKIASFPYGNAENMFYNFVVLFFKSVRNGGRNSMRVYRTCSVFFFLPEKKRRVRILCVSIELVLHFCFPLKKRRGKFYAKFGGNTTILTLLIFK